MKIDVQRGDIIGAKADAVVLTIAQGEPPKLEGALKAADKALGGTIAQMRERGEVRAKASELTLVHSLGKLAAPRLMLAGLGKPEKVTADTVRNAAAEAMRRLRASGARSVAFAAPAGGPGALDAATAAQAIAEGAVLGLYRFDRHKAKKKDDDDERRIDQLTIYVRDSKDRAAAQQGATRGRILAEAANFARDMANEPANHLNPTDLAQRALDMAQERGIGCRILERADMEQLGMGSALSVAQGSVQPPKFIILEYKGGKKGGPTLGLIGKGITFDTGGISIKPAAGMEEMKGDMSGAAAVIAAMSAIAQLKPKANITALAPATENMPSGSATKPGDVVRAMNGTTIEVINTDAEGRLILADALCYANKLGLAPLVDVATLTGACVIALGSITTGAMTNNAALLRQVFAAGDAAGEKFWELPMFEEYAEQIKSDVADLKNVGGREAGTITAAKFLEHFVDKTPWVHLDMAGTDGSTRERGVMVKGATGIPVRTLVHFAMAWAADSGT